MIEFGDLWPYHAKYIVPILLDFFLKVLKMPADYLKYPFSFKWRSKKKNVFLFLYETSIIFLSFQTILYPLDQ